METKVFVVDKKKAMEIVDNPEIKRKGEAKYYDPKVLGIDAGFILIVKGDENLLLLDIFSGLKECKDKERILKKIEEMNENAATGVGMIFGN